MNSDFPGSESPTFLDQWRYYSYYGCTPSSVYKFTKNSQYLVRRLAVKEEISGHSGCVNTVHWNKSGTILLSGSDDRYLNLYSYPTFHMLERIKSGHKANIFNAKFIPHSNDTKICSCSGDGIMHYNDVTDKRSYGKNPFKCHVGIVYDVITHNQDPNGFISCGEDGTVRYYDLRVHSSCNCLHCNRHILLDIRQPITSCTLNPLNPNEIVIGCDDSTIRAYDRRFRFTQESQKIVQHGRPPSSSSQPIDPKSAGVIYAYRPSAQSLDSSATGSHFSNRLTCLTFNWRGDELLASYCPSLLTLISTVPKINPTVTEASNARSRLFDDCFLFPGGISNESDKPHKKLVPFSERRRSSHNSRGSDFSKSCSRRDHTNVQGVQNSLSTETLPFNPLHENIHSTSTDTSTDINIHAVSNDIDNEHVDQTTSVDLSNRVAPSNVDNVTTLPQDSNYMADTGDIEQPYYSRVINNNESNSVESQQQPILSSPLYNSNNNNMDRLISAPNLSSTPINRVENFSETNQSILRENLEIIDTNVSFSSENNTRNNISIETDGDHSSRTAPLPRTRSIMSNDHLAMQPSSDVTNYDYSHSETTNISRSEPPSTNPSSNHQLNDDDNNNSRRTTTESDSRGSNNSNEFKRKTNTRKGRVESRWESFGSSFSKGSITDDSTAKCSNSIFNLPSIDYNPYFFDTVESLNIISEHDRLRCYLDNIFVPSYIMNYRGHHNSRTMIKECNFYGDDFVMSGSDDGNVFIWDKCTCELVNVFNADNNVVNCLQPHPLDPVIACSGIDSSIKIVAPIKSQAVPAREINAIIASNEREMRGISNYYFDATPTMIFHVLLALERIQRNRGDENSQPNNNEANRGTNDHRTTLTNNRDIVRRTRESLRTYTNLPGFRGWRTSQRHISEIEDYNPPSESTTEDYINDNISEGYQDTVLPSSPSSSSSNIENV